jgi:hypothetical protein
VWCVTQAVSPASGLEPPPRVQEQIWTSLALDFQEKRVAIPRSSHVGQRADHGLPALLAVERDLEIQYAIAELIVLDVHADADVAGRLLDRPDFGVTRPRTPELPDARKVGSGLRQKRRSRIASE